jgi:hypothetical protein
MVIFHGYVSNKKTISGWWLTYPSEKNESVGMMKFPTEWKQMFQTTKQKKIMRNIPTGF